MVKIIKLSKEFKNLWNRKKIVAVDKVNLEIKKGEIVALLGPNGAGKTTLLKMICGLINPTSGEIYIDGLKLSSQKREVLKKTGAVLEGSRNSLWSMSVKQNLIYFGYLKNVYGQELRKRMAHLLNFFQLEEKREELVKRLSNGMKQKLAIALAFISDPQLVLLDEPTAALDVPAARLIKEKIKEISKTAGKTIILTTHQMGVAQEIADRVAIINQGRIITFDHLKNLINKFSSESYEIKLKEKIDLTRLHHLPVLKKLKGEEKGKEDGFFLFLTLKEANSIFKVMEVLGEEGAKILSIQRKEPSLEEIFLQTLEN